MVLLLHQLGMSTDHTFDGIHYVLELKEKAHAEWLLETTWLKSMAEMPWVELAINRHEERQIAKVASSNYITNGEGK